MNAKSKSTLQQACEILVQGASSLSVLNTLSWPVEAKAEFLAREGRELPRISYEKPDVSRVLEAVAAARALPLADDEVGDWIRDSIDAIEKSARLAAAVGTAEVHEHSVRLYGHPKLPLDDGFSTPLELAESLLATLGGLDSGILGAPAEACHLASALAERMEKAAARTFGDAAPVVEIVDNLRANATAGAERIRVRRDACFTDRDLRQLVEHEVLVHAATALNGRQQTRLPLLGLGHAGTTRTQEGLAVFAEMITGALDVDRLGRLANRVVAIQMAMEGADFLEVYRFFLERTTGESSQAYENTRRVFRGTPLTGGAPFTKDGVYLDGMLRVHTFMKAAASRRRLDCLQVLFCGRLDLAHVPALCRLAQEGLIVPPPYLPKWVKDRRFLIAHLAYAAFTNVVHLEKIAERVDEMMSSAPQVDWANA